MVQKGVLSLIPTVKFKMSLQTAAGTVGIAIMITAAAAATKKEKKKNAQV